MSGRAHPPELRKRAIDRFHALRREMPSKRAAYRQVAVELNVDATTVQRWVQLDTSPARAAVAHDERLATNPDTLSRREREELLLHAGQTLEDTLPEYENRLKEALRWAKSDPAVQALDQIAAATEHLAFVSWVRARMMVVAQSIGLSLTEIARHANMTPTQARRLIESSRADHTEP